MTLRILLVSFVAATLPAAARAEPVHVRAVAPASVAVGRAFAITLVGDRPVAVGGLELAVGAPPGALGRVTALAADGSGQLLDERRSPRRRTVGFFGARTRPAPVLGQILVTAQTDGRLSLALGRLDLVAPDGTRITTTLDTRRLTLSVGSGGAPQTGRRIAERTLTPVAPAADRTGDGVIDAADVADAALAWQRGAETTVGELTGLAGAAAVAAPIRRSATVMPTLTYTVTTTADDADAAVGDHVCQTAAGACSLRAAIDESNRRIGDELIAFAIPGDGPQTIRLTSLLPQINSSTGAVAIDGYTQPGTQPNTDATVSNARLRITVAGFSEEPKDPILVITSSGNDVRGLAFTDTGRAIVFYGERATANTIRGNWLGMDATGRRATFTGYAAIQLDGAPRNRIGSPAPADRNVVAGFFYGLDHVGPGTDENVVQGNMFSMSPDGGRVWPAACDSIDFNIGPKRNVVGGLGPGERNSIAGGGCNAIELSHGWNPALPPRTDMAERFQVNDNRIVGNYLGLRADGTFDPDYVAARDETQTFDGSGVNIIDVANRNVVQGNVIASGRSGVQIAGVNTTGNVVADNTIGTDAAGRPAEIGRSGVTVRWDADTAVITGNRIANTGGPGVAIQQANDDGVVVSRTVFDNIAGPGIALARGANGGVRAPVLDVVSTTAISGHTAGGAVVELFRTRAAPGMSGPGEEYLQTATADGAGRFAFPGPFTPGDVMTATATVPAGTSAFSIDRAVPGAAPRVGGVRFDAFVGRGPYLTGIRRGTKPVETRRLTLLRAPLGRGDHQGIRLRALVTAPTTGAYQFWLSADETAVLALGRDHRAATRRVIARVRRAVPYGAYDTSSGQRSGVIQLVAGQRYFIELFTKDGTGADHATVAWAGPGFARQEIAAAFLTPTSGGCRGWCPR